MWAVRAARVFCGASARGLAILLLAAFHPSCGLRTALFSSPWGATSASSRPRGGRGPRRRYRPPSRPGADRRPGPGSRPSAWRWPSRRGACRTGRGAEAHAQKVHEQPVGGLGPVLDSELDLHDVLKGRDVPETGLDSRLRRRFTKNLLQLLLLRPLELCRVLVAGVTGYHGAQPGLPPLRQPLTYRPLGPLDHLRDNIQADAAGSVHNRLRLHSHQLAECPNASST